MLSSSEALTEISHCGSPSEPPVPSYFSSRQSPAKPLSTKTVILSTCSYLRNLSAVLGFPTRYRAARFNGTKSNSRGSLILWAKCFAVHARSNLAWARYKSLMQADLYRVASSLFRIGLRLRSNTSLSCTFSLGVLTASVFALHPDSLMMSGACLKSGSMSKYCPVRSTPALNTRFNSRKLFTSESSNPSVPMSVYIWISEDCRCVCVHHRLANTQSHRRARPSSRLRSDCETMLPVCLPLRKPPNSPQNMFT